MSDVAMYARRAGKTALADAPARCACGVTIPLKRRLAVPGCRRCADCQEVAEKIWAKQQRDGRV
jgi:Prokaryotic dksA/traR C4-type zinc finger